MRNFISTVLVVATAAALAAQSPARYDCATEQTISGTIKTAVSYPSVDGAVGVHFDLRTSEGIVDVRVGPAMFIGQENFWFFADESIVVTGSRVGGPEGAIWAKTIKKGANTLVLRNDDGTPRWKPASDGADGCGVNHLPLQRTTLH